MLSVKDCLVRKATVFSKLDEYILDNIEDEEGIAKKIDTSEAFYKLFSKKVIEIEQFFTRLWEKANNKKFPESRFLLPFMRERKKGEI